MNTSIVTEKVCTGGLIVPLLDALPEALLYVDADGVVEAASGRFEEFFGIPSEDLAGKPLSTLAERIAKCFTEFMTYHEIMAYPQHDLEHEFIRDVEVAAPKHRFLQVASAPVLVGERPAGRLWSFRDVTSEREITDLKIQYGGARGADELKSKFLTVVSHQLRTPLNSVRWNMELLLGGEYPAVQGDVREVMQEVYKAVVNSISIVDDMIVAVDIEQRTLRLEKSETDVGDLLNKVVHGFARSAELKGVKLALQPLPKDLPRLYVDGDKIEKVLNRLIDNAIRYTPSGGSVTVSAWVGKKDVSVTVVDTGIGIAEEDRQKMFQRFFRSKKAIGTHPNASGLGLYISKFIVDAHDGAINFDSEEGRGSTFTVTLPRRMAAQ